MFQVVRECISQVLRIPEEEVEWDSILFDDLGAESIDIIELEFALEERFNVEISVEGMGATLMGALSSEEFFDSERMVTPAGLEQIAKIVPGFDPNRWKGELNEFNLQRILTVGCFCRYLGKLLNGKLLNAQ
jgi:acyl carrier protein